MEQWKYAVSAMKMSEMATGDIAGLIEEMNRDGRNGWELVSVVVVGPLVYQYFKKKVV